MDIFQKKNREEIKKILKTSSNRVAKDIQKSFDILNIYLSKREELIEALVRRNGEIVDFNSQELDRVERSIIKNLKEIEKQISLRDRIRKVLEE